MREKEALFGLDIYAMKFFDRFLQNWRTQKAIKQINSYSEVLDIGCYDAIVFEKLGSRLKQGIGIDPLIKPLRKSNYELINGYFPSIFEANKRQFDAITMLAVLEHIPNDEIKKLSISCYEYLKPGGQLIITVPDAKVDIILEILKRVKLIDGMSLEEHHGFDTKSTRTIFEQAGLVLIKHSTFQLGLNNLFVFQKK